MTAIAKRLDEGLRSWRPRTAKKIQRLVSEIITLANGENGGHKTSRKPKAWDKDSFFADAKVFRGKTPKNLAAKHDEYLYGDKR